MQNRIEVLRRYIEDIIYSSRKDIRLRSFYYNHMSCVSQFCALIALRRGEDVELATIAGLLHDIHTFVYFDSEKHAKKGSLLAREILTELMLTTDEETDKICSAIRHHSKKSGTFSAFDEILIDADVMEHSLYNATMPPFMKDKERFEKLLDEFGLKKQGLYY